MSLGRVTTLLFAGRIAGYALALVNSIIVARTLGVDRLGAYAYAMGLAAIFGLLPNMGISTIVTRTLARNPDEGRSLLRSALGAQALLSSAVALVIPIFAAVLPGQPVPVLYVALAGAQLAVGTLSWPYLAVLAGRARYDRVAACELLSAATSIVCVGLAALGYRTVLAILIAQVVAAAVAVGIAVQIARPFLPAHERGHGEDPRAVKGVSLRQLLRQSMPFGATAAADSLYTRIDILLLGQLSSTTALGLYNVAYKPTHLAVYLGGTLAGPLFPLLSRAHEDRPPPSFRIALRGLGVAAPAMALILSGLATPLIELLYGREYRAAAPILVVLAWSAAAHWLYAPLGVALQARGQERWWLACLLGGLLLNGLGNVWAIPKWGALGAATMTLISELALLAMGSLLVARCVRALPSLRLLAAGAVATAVAGALLWLMPGGAWVATLAALALYGTLTLAFGLVRARDAFMVWGWIREAVPGGCRA